MLGKGDRGRAPAPATSEQSGKTHEDLAISAEAMWRRIAGAPYNPRLFPGFATSFDGNRATWKKKYSPTRGLAKTVFSEGGCWFFEIQNTRLGTEFEPDSSLIIETQVRPLTAGSDGVAKTGVHYMDESGKPHVNVIVEGTCKQFSGRALDYLVAEIDRLMNPAQPVARS
ncbi:MAG TPA: hypothetical protein VGG13_03710 [Candidatus Saccharimonadales bacterium]|jgi:hypothetical protein